MASQDRDPENTFKILIASDIHLGYCDSDPRRENDSFNTFEEIFEIAKEERVDFMLLGGDLFHDNKPKPSTLKRTIEIMKKHCLGSRPVTFEYLGDPQVDFKGLEDPQVNYYSPDMNIEMPVFTIHGNHDDPIGNQKTSAVDHISAAGLVNHFGQSDGLNEVYINPVLLRKGETLLALYGLGCMKDERLHRLFRDRKVKFAREPENKDSWFNIFVLHQNRIKHGATNYIPPNYFPSFLHFVLWGHEHECRIMPVDDMAGIYDVADNPEDANPEIYISQPGSSVATSLCPGEAVEKFVGILYVNKKEFTVVPKKLKTVRPFLFADIDTSEVFTTDLKSRDPSKFLETFVESKVKAMRDDSADLLTGHPNQPVEPLVRVRILYENDDVLFHGPRFSQKFSDAIANSEIVTFKKKTRRNEFPAGKMDVNEIHDFIMDEEVHDLEGHVEEIVQDFFKTGRENNDATRMLDILSERALSEAVKSCVEKSDKETMKNIITLQMDRVVEHLKRKNVDSRESILEELKHFQENRYANAAAEENEMITEAMKNFRTKIAANNDSRSRSFGSSNNMDSDDDNLMTINSDDDVAEISPPPSRGRGRGRGSRGGARGINAAASTSRSAPARGTAAPRRSRARARGGF